MTTRWRLAGLLLVASVAALRPPRSSLRELPPSICGFAHYGSAVGSAQRLVETHLAPGVADWNIVVPMPPPCADAQVTGVDMRVCDADAQPDVFMSDVRSARVHRAGTLAGFAAVNVTVYCILPPPPPTPPPAIPQPSSESPTPASDPTDSSSTDEMSNETSFEVSSNEEMSKESVSMVSASVEVTTTAKPTSSTSLPTSTTTLPTSTTTFPTSTTTLPTSTTTLSTSTTTLPTSTTTLPTSTTTSPTSTTTLPPIPEQTTARVVAPPTKEVTHPSDKTIRPKGKKPQSIQVTINITPTDQLSTEEGKSQAYDVELPLLSNKEKKNEVRPPHSPRFSSVPYIATPPRFPEMPPWKHVRHQRRPGTPQHQPAPGEPGSPLFAPPYPPRAPFAAPSFPLAPSYPVAPLYRPIGLTDPRLMFLQRRQPLMFFRQF